MILGRALETRPDGFALLWSSYSNEGRHIVTGLQSVLGIADPEPNVALTQGAYVEAGDGTHPDTDHSLVYRVDEAQLIGLRDAIAAAGAFDLPETIDADAPVPPATVSLVRWTGDGIATRSDAPVSQLTGPMLEAYRAARAFTAQLDGGVPAFGAELIEQH